VSPGCVASASISLLDHQGLRGRRARPYPPDASREAGIQVLYERCAAVDVGKDVIAVAVRLPGDGPDGRATRKRTFKTFYGVLREAARWLSPQGVTQVAMEATGIYSMPVYHALIELGEFAQVLVCNAGHVKNVPGRKTDLADAVSCPVPVAPALMPGQRSRTAAAAALPSRRGGCLAGPASRGRRPKGPRPARPGPLFRRISCPGQLECRSLRWEQMGSSGVASVGAG
jgi:hypothetical protein